MSNTKPLHVSWRGANTEVSSLECNSIVYNVLMWTLWLERNKRTFDGEEASTKKLKSLFLSCLYEWMIALGGYPRSTLADYIDDLNLPL